MRCLVTGASGFVGSHLARKLVSSGNDVLAVVRASSNLWRIEDVKHRIALEYADLSQVRDIREKICSFQPSVVFHLAWKGGNSRKFLNDEAQALDNIPGSLELVQIAHQAGCRGFIFLGSSVEYGHYRQPVRETDPVEPTNLYGLSKYTTLQLSRALCAQYGMRFIGVRLFWAYGPMDDPQRMVPSVVEKLARRERPSLTPGEQMWDFLYIDDVVAALIALATTDTAEGIFNVGSGSPVSIREMVSCIRDEIDPSLELGFGEVPYAPDQVMHLEADVRRLQAATGWKPQVSLADGIRRTVQWYARGEAPNGI